MLWQPQDHHYRLRYNRNTPQSPPQRALLLVVYMHTQRHTEIVWASQTQQIVPRYPHPTNVAQVYKVTSPGLHLASMRKMATRKKLLRRKEFKWHPGRQNKGSWYEVKMQRAPWLSSCFCTQDIFGHQYVAPTANFFNREPLICLLNWRHPS